MKMKPLEKLDLTILELAHIERIAICLFELDPKRGTIRAVYDTIDIAVS